MSNLEDQKDARYHQFGDLLQSCHRNLYSYIFALVQHHADAEDVYQQVATVLWEKFDDFEIGTNFAAWATRVAQLTAKDFLRSRRKRELSLSGCVLEAIATSYSQKPSSSDEVSGALEGCLQKLSSRERRLVERCYAPGRCFQQIAKDEGQSVGAIYQAICRIRKRLFRCITSSLARENH